MREVRLLITGRVQGVFFRYNVRKKSLSLRLTGFVRNLSDGSVEVVAQGEKMGDLITYCRKGPSFARVDDIKITNREIKEKFSDFRILY